MPAPTVPTAGPLTAAVFAGDINTALSDLYDLATAAAAWPRGYIDGLILSNNGTDPTNDIDIAAGVARDVANAANLTLAASITKRLDAAWAVGTNQGGLDTGSIANGTYHVWLIGRSDTGVVDALFSTSATAPTMPTNYDQKRRIGSVLRESAALVTFVQTGDEFWRNTPVLDVNANDPGTTAVTRTLSVPTGIRVNAIYNASVRAAVNTTVSCAWLLSDLSLTDNAASGTAAPLATVSLYTDVDEGNNSVQARTWTNTSAQIRSRANFSDTNTTVRLATLGWVDPRGKNA